MLTTFPEILTEYQQTLKCQRFPNNLWGLPASDSEPPNIGPLFAMEDVSNILSLAAINSYISDRMEKISSLSNNNKNSERIMANSKTDSPDASNSNSNFNILIQDLNMEPTCTAEMDTINFRKRLRLTPSYFINGCVCGHELEFRDMAAYGGRKQHKCPGITIRPKTPPIAARLRRNG